MYYRSKLSDTCQLRSYSHFLFSNVLMALRRRQCRKSDSALLEVRSLDGIYHLSQPAQCAASEWSTEYEVLAFCRALILELILASGTLRKSNKARPHWSIHPERFLCNRFIFQSYPHVPYPTVQGVERSRTGTLGRIVLPPRSGIT